MNALMNPDCSAGKHWNCDGESWDNELDGPAPCPCSCHQPAGKDEAHPSPVGASLERPPYLIEPGSMFCSVIPAGAVPDGALGRLFDFMSVMLTAEEREAAQRLIADRLKVLVAAERGAARYEAGRDA